MKEKYGIESSDLSLYDIVDICKCQGGPVKHGVMLDLRAAGTSVEIYRGCRICCESFIKRVCKDLAA